PNAPTSWGRLEALVQQSGVAASDAEDSLSEVLAATAGAKRSVPVTTDARSAGPMPFRDYQLGDFVGVRGPGWVKRRVVSATINATPEGLVTVATEVGARFTDALYNLARNQSQASGGAVA